MILQDQIEEDRIKKLLTAETHTTGSSIELQAALTQIVAQRDMLQESVGNGALECLRLSREINAQAAEIERLRAALGAVAEGDVPRRAATVFRDDGQPSKSDRCEHGMWHYEDCGECISGFAHEALKGKA